MSQAHTHEVERQQTFLLRLLFDAEMRERFVTDRQALFDAHDLCATDRALFGPLSSFGLLRDATMRADYLMRAICRGFPLSANALGSRPGGRAALAGFLSSPALFGATHLRQRAFGKHLRRLLDLDRDLHPKVRALIGALLAIEIARVENATSVRAAWAEGAPPPVPSRPRKAQRRRGKVALAPFTLVAELPFATSLIHGALGGHEADAVWPAIDAGSIQPARLVSVARSIEMPVTTIERGVIQGHSIERGAGDGLSPLVDVAHHRAEVAGRRAEALASFDGTRTLAQLPSDLRRLADGLLDAGLLVLIED